MTSEEAVFELGQIDTEFIFTARQKEAYKMAINALEEQQKYRWIPVTERLPEEEGEYICQVESECVCILGFTKDASKVDWFCFGDKFKGKTLFYEFDYELGYYEREAVAWMPLPEPYKEVEE